MNVRQKIKKFYKATEISPEFQTKVNILNLIFQFSYSIIVALIAALFPIHYGFVYISNLLEKGETEAGSSLSIKEGLLTFEGGIGGFLVLIGFLMIFVTTYRVFVKK